MEPEKFKRLYRLYDALYLSAAFALFTTVAVFLMPIIALYTSGVTDAEYLDTRLLVLFTAVELLFSAKQPSGMLLNISGRFEETRQQALIEMGINLLVSVMSVLRFGIAGCLFGTLAAHLYRYTALILLPGPKCWESRRWAILCGWASTGCSALCCCTCWDLTAAMAAAT